MKEKKTKAKKRFQTPNQIRDEIDKFKDKALRFVQQAEGLELAAKELVKSPVTYEDGVFKREQAKKCRASARRIHEVKLRQLKEKLAEMNTNLIPGILDPMDRSVQAY
jgi:hypothetical protein